MTEKQIVHIPMDVPRDMRGEYEKNYLMLTHESGNLMLFAGDQKVTDNLSGQLDLLAAGFINYQTL